MATGQGKLEQGHLGFDLVDELQLFALVRFQKPRNGLHIRHRVGEGPELFLQRQRLRQRVGHHRPVQHRLVRRMDELLLKHHRRQPQALHVQQIIIKEHLRKLRGRQGAGDDDQPGHQHRSLQPQIFNARPGRRRRRRRLVIQLILPALQQHHRQQRHHGNETDQQAAPADEAHFLDALEIRERHGEERPGGGQRARQDALAGIDHRLGQRRFPGQPPPQFLLVTCDQMDAIVNRQPD